ncbi:MAG: 3-deoxy-manno-octulosonate cytidylyltransferase [Bacteroidia bacterium]|nr:3-deoxy-manno-octulosonate cytidylyltransferase [Nitrosopumilus sp.]
MKFLGVIPARYASTRFPGKPLVDIAGKSMIQRVYEQAIKCECLSKVLVATDDEQIFSHVESFGGEVMMTSSKHKSGTDRCAEVAKKSSKEYEIIVNIQGDEPFVEPLQIEALCRTFADYDVIISTLIKKITDAEDLTNPNIPKVVIDNSSFAIYFSRAPIPHNRRSENKVEWLKEHIYYKHIGMYAYRRDALMKIARLPESDLEKTEALEQLRWLENGFRIKTAVTDIETIAIDTPDDLLKTYNKI